MIFCNPSALILSLLLLLGNWSLAADDSIAHDLVAFAKSFVTTLTVAPESRFTREYHPYLLKKTVRSLQELEQAVMQAGITCSHRIALMGYEQNAIPNYGYCLSSPAFADEAVVKSPGGWSFSPGNIFGYLTGFLLKDAQALPNTVVEHQLAPMVELFNAHTETLREHAFGSSHAMIMCHHGLVTEKLLQRNPVAVLQELATFWQRIYADASVTSTGVGAATQDILFSLFYAQHVIRNPITLQKIFTGPDITYPITVSAAQPLSVTENAQWFVAHFCQQLVPRNNRKTAYIFCSFVDGVGKSTMLGNVRNYRKYGTNFAAYEPVNNSSSQMGTLYDFDDNVILVDLPAQLSHFTPKPEGYVFVDVEFCSQLSATQRDALKSWVQQERHSLTKTALQRLAALRTANNSSSLVDAVLSNCITLAVEPAWIPFVHDGMTYAFEKLHPEHIRLCLPLSQTPSQGLKIPEPELMIFNQGLFIPMAYSAFVADLIGQLQQAGVEEVVFVDFMSMYPRSSRETVRINYLLQHLKRYYQDDFAIQASIGTHMAHRQALYGLLFDHYEKTERSLYVETLLRWVLHTLLADAGQEGLTVINDHMLQQRLQEKIALLHTPAMADATEHVLAMVRTKLQQEREQYRHYEYGTFYQSIITNSWHRLAECTAWHSEVIGRFHPDSTIRTAWQAIAGDVVQMDEQQRTVVVQGGATMQIVQELPAELDAETLQKILSIVRPLWLDQLIGIGMPAMMQGRYQEALTIKLLPTGSHAICASMHEQFAGLPTMQLSPSLYTWGVTAMGERGDETVMEQLLTVHHHDFFAQYNEPVESFALSTQQMLTIVQEAEKTSPTIWRQAGRLPVDPAMLPQLASYCAQLYSYCKSPTDLVVIRHAHDDDIVAAQLLFMHYLLPIGMAGSTATR